jgi:hypothetical protein
MSEKWIKLKRNLVSPLEEVEWRRKISFFEDRLEKQLLPF